MIIKSLLSALVLALSSVVAPATSASVYLDVRAAKLAVSGTPSIGDDGQKISDDLPSNAFTIAFGYTLNARVSLEARFTRIGDIRIRKAVPLVPVDIEFPSPTLFYSYRQATKLYTLALPVQAFKRGAFSLSVSPLAHLEHSRYTIADAGVDMPVPTGPSAILLSRTRQSLRAGGEVSAAYRINQNLTADVSYSYSNLQAYGAHLIGAGLTYRF